MKPFSEIERLSGKNEPSKLGLGQFDDKDISVVLPTGIKLIDSEPFRFIEKLKTLFFVPSFSKTIGVEILEIPLSPSRPKFSSLPELNVEFWPFQFKLPHLQFLLSR
jgi:hypothetical protein